MKKSLPLFSIVIACIYCFSFTKTDVHQMDTPTLIILRDTNRSITLETTQSGSIWVISSGDATAYLDAIAESFGKELGSFTNIQLEFDSLYTKGFLSGIGIDGSGARVPIGVEYAKTSGTSTTLMDTSTEHTCTGAPCSCCAFITLHGNIVGCRCETSIPCEGTTCNHTVKAVQKN